MSLKVTAKWSSPADKISIEVFIEIYRLVKALKEHFTKLSLGLRKFFHIPFSNLHLHPKLENNLHLKHNRHKMAIARKKSIY